jgi:AcrR family transcriptional regulator
VPRPGQAYGPRYTPERLLAVAAAVFLERGYDGTSMEDLARAAGIGKSSIYHHVAGKEALLRAATDRALDALEAVLRDAAACAGRPIDRFEQVVRRSAELLIAELPYVSVLLRLRGNTPAERAALDRRRGFDRQVAALVAEAASRGELRADLDPHLATRLVFGTINSVAEWYTPGAGDPAEVVDGVLALVFTGLLPRGRAGTVAGA